MSTMVESSENELLSKLTALTKDKTTWLQSMAFTADLLTHSSDKVKAKALWLMGEMGLRFPIEIAVYVPQITVFLLSEHALLRERALNALGRVGRGDANLTQPYLEQMRTLASDAEPSVRLAFIWACENIAVNSPALFETDLPLFFSLLHDGSDRVRIEAPEIFRVLGSRMPNAVMPYRAELIALSENDENKIVRVHAAGAVRALEKGRK